jgi:hypothetical protein
LAAIIAGSVALLGYPVTNFFTTRREARAKELAFKLDCYQGFLKSFFALANEPSYETQLAFTHSVNVLNLMASPEILAAVHALNNNYEKSSEDRQWKILDEMLFLMRRDMLGRRNRVPPGYKFPVIVVDTDRFPPPSRKRT